MIAGMEIAEALSKLIGPGGYDSSKHKSTLPATMRELLNKQFEPMELRYDSEDDCEIKSLMNIDAGSANRYQGINPIRPQQFKIKRPPAPEAVEVDARVFYPLLSSFYKWLKKKGMASGIDIDHTFNKQGWPLWLRFEKEIQERTSLNYGVFFPQEQWDIEEPMIWDVAYMPLYDMNSDGTSVPLLEFLHDISEWYHHGAIFKFPEAAYDQKDINKVKKADEILHNIIVKNKLGLLPQAWDRAIRAVVKFKDEIAYHDYDEVSLYINSSDDIEKLFKTGKKVAEMLDGTEELIEMCQTDGVKFWNEFIEALVQIKVFNEEKNKIRV